MWVVQRVLDNFEYDMDRLGHSWAGGGVDRGSGFRKRKK